MRRLTITFLLLIVACGQALGEEQNIPRNKISAVVKLYAGTIGCIFPLDEQNIVKYSVEGGYDGVGEYVVLFGIDPKCSGGSAMYHSALAVLESDYRGNFFIHPGQSFPVNSPDGLPQYVDKIYVENEQLLFHSKEFDTKDARCCPSLQVTGRLFMKEGKWIAEILKKENH
jgi:hypothetical protein